MTQLTPFVPPVKVNTISDKAVKSLAERERISDLYWTRKDRFNEMRIWWRACTARHLFHILPGETILDLACGSGKLTQALLGVTRGECPITAATFDSSGTLEQPPDHPQVERVRLTGFAGELEGRQFDYVIASNVLDQGSAASLLTELQKLIKPGGRLLFFETNPWNPVFRLRKTLGRVFPFVLRGDERDFYNQVQLYELLSEVGYISIGATCYDFLYPPIPKWTLPVARTVSLVMENTPGVKLLAGTILLNAQKPPRGLARPPVRLTEHQSLHGAVSFVVPCYNEEMNLGPLVDGILRHYDEYVHEIVLVDDNSKDGSRAIMQSLQAFDSRVKPVFRKPPNGVGLAIAEGLKAATGRYVLSMDCDFLHILPELREMFDEAAAGADVVLGSRFSRSSVLVNYPLQKILCNRGFHLLLNLIFWRKMRDVTNNLKLMKREVVANLDLEAAWFAVNSETGLKPILMGYDVRPVAISWINRTPEMGQSSFSLVKNGLGYVSILFRLAWRTRFGKRPLPRKIDPKPASETAKSTPTAEASSGEHDSRSAMTEIVQ
jgi:2-polyprenyl-3-methyl-5-hydroxy-6-metoxy-1,4-benzoquinol methylase